MEVEAIARELGSHILESHISKQITEVQFTGTGLAEKSNCIWTMVLALEKLEDMKRHKDLHEAAMRKIRYKEQKWKRK